MHAAFAVRSNQTSVLQSFHKYYLIHVGAQYLIKPPSSIKNKKLFFQESTQREPMTYPVLSYLLVLYWVP